MIGSIGLWPVNAGSMGLWPVQEMANDKATQ